MRREELGPGYTKDVLLGNGSLAQDARRGARAVNDGRGNCQGCRASVERKVCGIDYLGLDRGARGGRGLAVRICAGLGQRTHAVTTRVSAPGQYAFTSESAQVGTDAA